MDGAGHSQQLVYSKTDEMTSLTVCLFYCSKEGRKRIAEWNPWNECGIKNRMKRQKGRAVELRQI